MKSKPNPHAAAMARLCVAIETMRVRATELANAAAKAQAMLEKLRREFNEKGKR